MKQYISIISAIVLSINTLQAQVAKEVEVTKKYIPTIEKAVKPILKASMSDTAHISPEIDYTVTPLSINTMLDAKPIKPATITYWEFNRPTNFYVKAGAGAPLNTLLDLYAATQNSSLGYVMVHANHEGRYSKIKNDFGGKSAANRYLNDVGIAGGLYLGQQTLEGDFNYSNDTYHRYATTINDRLNYQKLATKVYYGDDFVDLSYLNFGINGGYDYFISGLSSKVSTATFAAAIAKDYDRSGLKASLGYDHASNYTDYVNNTLSANFVYSYMGEKWLLDIGGDLCFDNVKLESINNNHFYFLPDVNVKFGYTAKVVPYLTIKGDIHHNNYLEMANINPYVLDGFYANENSIDYNLTVGIHGLSSSQKFEYNVYVGGAILNNALFWMINLDDMVNGATPANAPNYGSNNFTAVCKNQYYTSTNFELKYRPVSGLLLQFDMHGYKYSRKEVDNIAYTQPSLKSALGAEYSINKLKVSLNAEYWNQRQFTEVVNGSKNIINIDPIVDLNIGANYKLNSCMDLFLDLDNVCNSKIYEFSHYRDYGISATAGVKIQF